MTPNQEEALYDFLENASGPFTLKNVTEYVGTRDSEWIEYLPVEIAALFASTLVAFRLDKRRWISRRGFFENVPFVISPTRLELLNGILIPGHAYSMEDFLFLVTENVESDVDYGIESRFWFAGKDIPDSKGLLLALTCFSC